VCAVIGRQCTKSHARRCRSWSSTPAARCRLCRRRPQRLESKPNAGGSSWPRSGRILRRSGGGGNRTRATFPTGRSPILGNERLPNGCRRPSVRAVNRWNLLRVQLLGDRLKGHPLSEHRVDLYPPPVVTSVAEPMRESDVVGCEVSAVHLESRIVVSRRLPIGTRRPRLEVPTTPEAVALGHLATHIDDLAISGKLPEDSANFRGLELLKWGLSIHEGQTRARTCQNLLLASVATGCIRLLPHGNGLSG